jgi:hypothetical protein
MEVIGPLVGLLVLVCSPYLVAGFRDMNDVEPGTIADRWMTASAWIVVVGVGLALIVSGVVAFV